MTRILTPGTTSTKTNGRPLILVVTSQTDVTAGLVIGELSSRGVDVFRFNTETYPTMVQLTMEGKSSGVTGHILADCGRDVALDEISAVYYRRPLPPDISSEIEDDGARQFALGECRSAIAGMIRLVEAPWVNHPDRIARAEYKILQLDEAQRLGFSIPDTLCTNDPVVAECFVSEHAGKVVAKTVRSPFASRQPPLLIYTNRLLPADLLRLKQLRLAPCILQEYVEKKLEVRATVVGNCVFAAEIDSQSCAQAVHDWRRVSPEELSHGAHVLPTEISERCVAITQRFGLSYSAIDLILTPMDEYVFLEMNPNGEWGWLAQLVDLPIAAAVSDQLLGSG